MKRIGASMGMEVVAAVVVALGVTAPVAAQAQSVSANQADESVALEADIVSEEKKPHRIVAEGDVEAIYQGRTLKADRVVYDLDTKRVHASGNVQIMEADGATRFADEVEVDDKLKDGVATGFSAQLPKNATVIANSAIRKADDKTVLGQAIYTACPICDAMGRPQKPTWTLRARRATQNQKTQMISYRDAVIEISGVPVFYTPYFTHADPTAGRRSGLLPPSISQSSALGFSYGQPYYWAISPSQDLTFTPYYHSKVALSGEAEYRKRFYSGRLDVDGSLTNERQFNSSGTEFGDKKLRGHVFASGAWDITPEWKWGFGIEETTDDLYPIRYKVSGEDKVRGPFQTRPRSLIDQLYVEGKTENSSTLVSAMKFDDLTIDNDPRTLPLVLPYVSYLRHFDSPMVGGQVSLDLNSASLTRTDDGADSQRVTAGASWNRRDIFGPGIVLEPFAEGRADYFRIRDYPTVDDSNSFGRGYASIGSVVRWPFQRTGAMNVIVEPIGMVSLGTNKPNDSRILNEDSPSFELDETALFRGNAAPNYDLIDGGASASLGLRVSANASNGFDGTAFIGRRWRDSPDSTFSEVSNLGKTASDYLAAVEANFGRRLTTNVRLRLDGDDLSLQRIDAGARTYIGPLTLGARYYRYDKALVGTSIPPEQAQISSSLQLNENFSFTYSLTRDFQTKTNRYQRIGIVYSDICTTIGLYYNRDEIQNRQYGPSEGIVLQITLATLGSVGND